MSRRRILNIATTKKQDNRLTFSNTDSPGVAPTQKNMVLSGGSVYMIPYLATAQDRSISGATAPIIPGYRGTTEVFMRGYRERISLAANSDTQWTLRRICFRFKGNAIINAATTLTPLWLEVSPNGFVRTASNVIGTGLQTELQSQMFKGEPNIDWSNLFTAPLDNNRITVAYDRTFHFRSGNGSAHVHNMKLWHPMNKKFYYRDDESGDGNNTSVLHTSGIKGMGDYFIVDIWQGATPETDDVLTVSYEGTLFWHER